MGQINQCKWFHNVSLCFSLCCPTHGKPNQCANEMWLKCGEGSRVSLGFYPETQSALLPPTLRSLHR